MKKMFSFLLILTAALILCSCHSSEAADVQSSYPTSDTQMNDNPVLKQDLQDTINAVKEGPIEIPTETEPAAVTESNFGRSELYTQIQDSIQESFKDFSPSLNYDEENHLLNIILVAGSGTDLALAVTPDTVADSWVTLTETLRELSSVGYEIMTDNHLNIGCTVMLLSDINPENALYGALNGIEVYNVLES